MSDEAREKPAEAAASQDEETKEQNANQDAEIENGESTKEPGKKFSVNRVKFGPELSDSPEDTDDSKASESPDVEPKSPTSPEHFTYGYATNEAIPMTIFYRSQHSQSHGGKQRPTLQELRKGMENEKVSNQFIIVLSGLHVIIIMHVIFSTQTGR